MSDHLPECPATSGVRDDNTRWEKQAHLCICDLLRACEQRVRDEDQRILIKHGAEQFVRGEQIGRPMGFAAGLRAARDALAGIEHWASYSSDGDVWSCWASNPLAAIDGVMPHGTTSH